MFKTPLLVDVKLTNHCLYGCDFCYMSSTRDGKVADLDTVLGIFEVLGNLEVFEVALGGGEPVTHPDIADILYGAKEAGPIPNLTTFALNWVGKPHLAKAVKDCVGGIALSVNNLYEATRKIPAFGLLNEFLDVHEWNKQKRLAVQTILGVMDQDSLIKTVQFTKDYVNRLTLLGYKRYGEGVKYKRTIHEIDFATIYDMCKKSHLALDLDTLAVQLNKTALKKLNVPEVMMSTKEGHSSMYIDATEMIFAKDSYTDEKIPFTLDDLEEKIRKHFPWC